MAGCFGNDPEDRAREQELFDFLDERRRDRDDAAEIAEAKWERQRDDEAKNDKCCTMDKACEGTACMAWRTHYTEDLNAPPRFGFRNCPAPAPLVESGNGYCGLARK